MVASLPSALVKSVLGIRLLACASPALAIGCSVIASSAQQAPFRGNADLILPGVTQSSGMTARDMNRDGIIDLVVLSGNMEKVAIFFGGRGGRLQDGAMGEIPAGPTASSFAIGDFNGDAVLDIAICHHDNDQVWILIGKGPGTFQQPLKVRIPVTKPHAHRIIVANIDKDKHLDFLVSESEDNRVWAFLGDGKGGFKPSAGSPVATGRHPYVVIASDFNKDSCTDFATPDANSLSVSIFLGNGSGGFSVGPGSPVGGFSKPTALAVGDLNGDGAPDLAVGNNGSRGLQLLFGDGNGRLSLSPSPLNPVEPCFGPVIADINGDGKMDVIASATNDAPTFSYWINRGDGRFSPAHALPCPAVANSMCVADFNGDGIADLAAGAWNEPRLYLWFGAR